MQTLDKLANKLYEEKSTQEGFFRKYTKKLGARILRKTLPYALSAVLAVTSAFGSSSCGWEKLETHPKTPEIKYEITIEQITSGKANKPRPKIHGNKIVFYKHEGTQRDPNIFNIYIYDLQTKTIKKILSGTNPSISANVVVNWSRYVYDISLGKILTPPGLAPGGNTDLYKYQLVHDTNWDKNSDIYLYDLASNRKIQITIDPSDQEHPSIWGNKIVWQDERNEKKNEEDIYLYDLSSGKEIPICTHPSRQIRPDIFGEIIVWEDERNGNSDIYMYDLSTKQEIRITTDGSDQERPSIYGDKIVWHDERNGGFPYYDIYMYDLRTKKEVRITQGRAKRSAPDIFENKIIWEEGDIRWYSTKSGETHIFMATINEKAIMPGREKEEKFGLEDLVLKQDKLPKGYTFTDSDAEPGVHNKGAISRLGIHDKVVKDLYFVGYKSADDLGSVGQLLIEFKDKESLQDSLPVILYEMFYDTSRDSIVSLPGTYGSLLTKDRFLINTSAEFEEALPLFEKLTKRLKKRGFEEVPLFKKYMEIWSRLFTEDLEGEEAKALAETFEKVSRQIKEELEEKTSVTYNKYNKFLKESKDRLEENFTNLTRTWKLKEKDPVYSPDGEHIAFIGNTVRWWREEYAPPRDAYVMDADGSNVRKILDNCWEIRWSKDGKGIYVEKRGISHQAYDIELEKIIDVSRKECNRGLSDKLDWTYIGKGWERREWERLVRERGWDDMNNMSKKEWKEYYKKFGEGEEIKIATSPDGRKKLVYYTAQERLTVELDNETIEIPKQKIIIKELKKQLENMGFSKEYPEEKIDDNKFDFHNESLDDAT